MRPRIAQLATAALLASTCATAPGGAPEGSESERAAAKHVRNQRNRLSLWAHKMSTTEASGLLATAEAESTFIRLRAESALRKAKFDLREGLNRPIMARVESRLLQAQRP